MRRILSAMILILLALSAAARAQTCREYMDAFARAAGVDAEAWQEDSPGVFALPLGEDASAYAVDEDGLLFCACVVAPAERAAALVGALLAACLDGDTSDAETLIPAQAHELVAETRDGVRVGAVRGENAATCFAYPAAHRDRVVWQPLRGGKRRHGNPLCSGMEGPRPLSEAAAQALGFERCKRCDWARFPDL